MIRLVDKIKQFATKKNFIIVILILIAFLALGSAIYFYNKSKATVSSSASAIEQAKAIDAKVRSLMEIPTNEIPQTARVSDKSKLVELYGGFFSRAENGDWFLIYTKANKGVLYRESVNKIIDVSTLNTTSVQTNPTPTNPTVTKTFNVYIANGTTVNGLASTTQKDLESKSTKFVVVGKGDATNSDYTKTLVIDLTKSNKSAAQELAGLVNGSVVNLPTGENAPSGADFLIILGQ